LANGSFFSNDGVVVGPCLFEPVGEKFNGLNALRPKEQKSSSGGTESANKPKDVFHCPFPFFPSCFHRWMREARNRWSVFLWVLRKTKISPLREETATLSDMDSVRFGRALGIGARAAAKTLVTAVDAATAPNPSAAAQAKSSSPVGTAAASSAGAPSAGTSGTPNGSAASTPVARLGQKTARTAAQVKQTSEGLKRGSKRFGEAVWGPTVRLSGILWLEFTGVFFGIFALFAAMGTWKLRGELHQTATNHDAHMHLLIAAIMAAVFSYFCVSSFVTASRRGRQR
jgi:hypothetical protein